jgi:hypothetical protein
MREWLLIGCITLAAAGCRDGDPGDPGDTALRPTGAAPMGPVERMILEAASTHDDYQADRFGTSFRIGAFHDLYLRFRFQRDAPAGRTVAVSTYLPGGALFRVDRREVEGDAVVLVLPVAGTELAARNVAGKYTFLVVLEPEGELLGHATLTLDPTEDAP